MSDARGFMVAAYVLTAVTLLGYALRLVLHARRVARTIAGAQEVSGGSDRPAGEAGLGSAEADLVGAHRV